MVHIDDMQATLDISKALMTVSKWTSPDESAISNILFMAPSSHDGLASSMHQKPGISKQEIFQHFALLNHL